MTPTFLDVQASVEQIFLTQLANQGFAVIMLIISVVYLVRRIKILEERQDKYVSEDREKLLDVISKNTSALDRIAGKMIAVLFIACIGFVSCVSRKVTTQTTLQKDSVSTQSVNKSINSVFALHDNTTRDSIITIPEQCVMDTFSNDELKPLFTSSGDTVANVQTMRSKGITGTVTVFPNGSIAFNCRSDSLLMVIRSLTYSRDSLVASFDTSSHSKANTTSQHNTSKEVDKTTSLFDIAKWVLIVAFGAAIIYGIWCIVKRKPLL